MTSTNTQPSRGSLERRGVRVAWAVAIALLSWVVFQVPGLPLLVGIVSYVVLTAISSPRRG